MLWQSVGSLKRGPDSAANVAGTKASKTGWAPLGGDWLGTTRVLATWQLHLQQPPPLPQLWQGNPTTLLRSKHTWSHEWLSWAKNLLWYTQVSTCLQLSPWFSVSCVPVAWLSAHSCIQNKKPQDTKSWKKWRILAKCFSSHIITHPLISYPLFNMWYHVMVDDGWLKMINFSTGAAILRQWNIFFCESFVNSMFISWNPCWAPGTLVFGSTYFWKLGCCIWSLFLETSGGNVGQYQQQVQRCASRPWSLDVFGWFWLWHAVAKPHLPKLGCYLWSLDQHHVSSWFILVLHHVPPLYLFQLACSILFYTCRKEGVAKCKLQFLTPSPPPHAIPWTPLVAARVSWGSPGDM